MAEVQDILVVLGAPNDAGGQLSPIALSRAQLALDEYRKRPGCKVVLTGGFGEAFNVTDQPHAHYVSEYLTGAGVTSADILEFAEGSNTVEDAVLARRVLRHLTDRRLCVITSDFHARRAALIFKHVFPGYELVVMGAVAVLPPEEQARRERHEVEALRTIQQQGGVVVPPECLRVSEPDMPD